MSPDAVTPFHLAVPEAELDELRARLHATRWPEREARLVALVAEEDHVPVDIAAEGRIRVTGHGVETPLEDVSRYEVRVGDDAVALALSLGPDVDQHGSGGDRGRSPQQGGAAATHCEPRRAARRPSSVHGLRS
jgi:hypothetical protein